VGGSDGDARATDAAATGDDRMNVTATRPDSRGRLDTWRSGPVVTAVAAEVGVWCVGVGTAFGFTRLFSGRSALVPLVGAVTASWVLAVAVRRGGLGVIRAAALSAVSGVLLLTWWFAPDTTTFGLPTPDTARFVLDEVRRSFADFSTLVAPVRAADGFLILLMVVLWSFTFFADTAAFRYRGPVQAVIPYASAFIAAGVLSRDIGRPAAAIVFLAGLGVYAVTQRALRSSERNWATGDADAGTRALVRVATTTLAVALAVGAVAGPWLPGDTDPVVDLRALGRGQGARTVVSPFVGVRNLLGPLTDQVVFTVTTTTPAYWRLTALDRYDPERDIWVSRGTYADVDGTGLGRPRTATPSRIATQDVAIQALGGPWLPGAYVPTSIQIDSPVGFDQRTSSIITRRPNVVAGTTYRLTSEIATLDPVDLNGSHGPERLDPGDLDVTSLSSVVRETARRVVSDQPTPYLRMLALQDWFRSSFEYSTDVDYSNAVDPIAEFLDAKRGFCQQFSSTFALMARVIGLPARVAVGFTPGDTVVDRTGTIHQVVRGRHAHAWPEVYFDGVGWVAFEPTPGRGNPWTSAYTGVPAQQAEPPNPGQASTSTSTAPAAATPSSTPTSAPPTTTIPTDSRADRPPEPIPVDDRSPARWMWVVVLGGVVAVAAAATVLWGRRRRSSTQHRDDTRIAVAWRSALSDLAAVDIRQDRSETPIELARRVGRSTRWDDPDDGPSVADTRVRIVTAMTRLAEAETARRFGRSAPDELLCEQAESAAAEVRVLVHSTTQHRTRRRQPVG